MPILLLPAIFPEGREYRPCPIAILFHPIKSPFVRLNMFCPIPVLPHAENTAPAALFKVYILLPRAILLFPAIFPLCIVYRLFPIPILLPPIRSPFVRLNIVCPIPVLPHPPWSPFCRSKTVFPIPILPPPENCALDLLNLYRLCPMPILLAPDMVPPLYKEYTANPIPTLLLADMAPPLGN